MKKTILILQLLFVMSCSQQEVGNISPNNSLTSEKSERLFYSQDFGQIYKVKSGTKVSDWSGVFAVSLQNISNDSCLAKLYLGKDFDFDYPQQGEFVNVTTERYDEIFSFTPDITDNDARLLAQRTFKASNKIAIRGFKDGKVTASTGFTIDYILRDVAENISIIKTDTTLCNVLNTKEYEYYLLLKPKGVDKSEDFFKFKLPLNE